MSTAAAVAAASALYNGVSFLSSRPSLSSPLSFPQPTGNLPSALLAAGHISGDAFLSSSLAHATRGSLVAEFTYKPPPEWLGEKKTTQLRKHADCCVRMDRTTHAIVRPALIARRCCALDSFLHVVSVQYSALKTSGDNMKELWNKAVFAGGSGSDEQRLLICALASQVTLGPLECSDSRDCWFFSVACGGRPLYLLWLRDDREVAAEALHASLSAFTEGAAAHEAAVASLAVSGLSPEAAASRVDVCGTIELVKNLCWQQASHMLFPMWHAVCKGEFHDFSAISASADACRRQLA